MSSRTRLGPIDEALHIARGGSTAGALRNAGARRVLFSFDSLATGPSSAEPSRHTALRARYWRAFFKSLPRPDGTPALRWTAARGSLVSADDFTAIGDSQSRTRPVVIWSGANWNEKLFLWWVCDALVRHRRLDVWIATHATNPSFAAEPEELLQTYGDARRIPVSSIRRGARLWNAFAEGRFERLMDAAPVPLGPLPPSAAALVPQAQESADSIRFDLSPYDRALLGLFTSREWSTALSRTSDPQIRRVATSLIREFGDLFLVARIEAWAHAESRLLESRANPKARSVMDAREYRLTEEGEAVLSKGLTDPSQAPTLEIGGFTAYAPDMGAAVLALGHDWKFVSLRRRPAHRSRSTR